MEAEYFDLVLLVRRRWRILCGGWRDAWRGRKPVLEPGAVNTLSPVVTSQSTVKHLSAAKVRRWALKEIQSTELYRLELGIREEENVVKSLGSRIDNVVLGKFCQTSTRHCHGGPLVQAKAKVGTPRQKGEKRAHSL